MEKEVMEHEEEKREGEGKGRKERERRKSKWSLTLMRSWKRAAVWLRPVLLVKTSVEPHN